MNDLISIMPLVILRRVTVMPGAMVRFEINDKKSKKALDMGMREDHKVFLLTQKNEGISNPDAEDLYKIGTIAYIKQLVRAADGVVRILVEGEERAQLLELQDEEEYLEAEISRFEPENNRWDTNTREAMVRGIKDLFYVYCVETGKMNKDLADRIMHIKDIRPLVDQICIHFPFQYTDRQKLLEAVYLEERYELLGVMLANEIEVSRIYHDFQEKVKTRIDQNQKEYIMREQMKVIREELGEENAVLDADEFTERLDKLEASKEVKDKISKEIGRFRGMGNNASESQISRTYIETLLELPWDKASKDSVNLKKAFGILQKDHYGLEKVKERIMEFLAVRMLTDKGETPILCLVGPPGTGKTSIAKSVANALNKKYVRICLGGIRDEAEIRGHRRTYIGAMPGRIAAGLRQAGVKNPLMLLDEIDKTSSDYKGDVSSSLLEVLDSEQNSHFRDHYVEIPLDLSEVLFIATANDTSTIPRPLLDRMEVIEISGYTENEKSHIAREHLISRQRKANGLKEKQLLIQNRALKKIINGYTREAGVRNLERKIGQICRKAAREILEGDEQKVTVTTKNLEHYLGKTKYTYQMANKKDEVGIVRGLAWTSVGGDTLQIEVNCMPGKGALQLTGKMGEVMKESAQIGASYIRSIAETYGIQQEFFKENDIHIHIPEGAVPKDGPSAGITMATAMLSAITGISVRADVAMTGEITLRGRVLPVGGLKEKLLAAQNARIKTVLVPKENRPDIEEFSEEITKKLRIVYVENMESVLKEAFVEE